MDRTDERRDQPSPPRHVEANSPPGWLARALRRGILSKLRRISNGEMELAEPGGTRRFGSPSDLRGRIEIRDPRAWTHIALRGTVGFGECYMRDWVRMDDPVSIVRLFVRNHQVMETMDSGASSLFLAALRLWHAARSNTRSGSLRNIGSHYDLGNDFYRLWLDETMMYSSAIWERPDQTQAEASAAKIDRICRKLALAPGQRVLEIGTGWGGFAIHAAGRYGCHVVTTTISREQFEFTSRRVVEAGLADKVDVLMRDYRDLEGTFDRVVSIEMVEAIGWRQFPLYLETIGRLLKSDGAALIQAITILDRRYMEARRSVDFIQRHIFPGSCIPSLSSLLEAAMRRSDLALVHLEDIGSHYARTLREWRERFLAKRQEVEALGFPDSFVRMWEWYLAYCEGGFSERQLGDAQLLFAKPDWPGQPPLGRL